MRMLAQASATNLNGNAALCTVRLLEHIMSISSRLCTCVQCSSYNNLLKIGIVKQCTRGVCKRFVPKSAIVLVSLNTSLQNSACCSAVPCCNSNEPVMLCHTMLTSFMDNKHNTACRQVLRHAAVAMSRCC